MVSLNYYLIHWHESRIISYCFLRVPFPHKGVSSNSFPPPFMKCVFSNSGAAPFSPVLRLMVTSQLKGDVKDWREFFQFQRFTVWGGISCLQIFPILAIWTHKMCSYRCKPSVMVGWVAVLFSTFHFNCLVCFNFIGHLCSALVYYTHSLSECS